ncbi:hypothetical protein NPIL_208261 [Nephila pilipes]|uniref:Uncharacterized protein n=1 Tax=Nephila pilipes TaxID=299642 RepID=A0A8X6NL00_NEPPI|nr:hypothetical protein NPIL_208261 [Nephila pilipes]
MSPSDGPEDPSHAIGHRSHKQGVAAVQPFILRQQVRSALLNLPRSTKPGESVRIRIMCVKPIQGTKQKKKKNERGSVRLHASSRTTLFHTNESSSTHTPRMNKKKSCATSGVNGHKTVALSFSFYITITTRES